jgi:hypothetical protein
MKATNTTDTLEYQTLKHQGRGLHRFKPNCLIGKRESSKHKENVIIEEKKEKMSKFKQDRLRHQQNISS